MQVILSQPMPALLATSVATMLSNISLPISAKPSLVVLVFSLDATKSQAS
jgi:hypothetical protein